MRNIQFGRDCFPFQIAAENGNSAPSRRMSHKPARLPRPGNQNRNMQKGNTQRMLPFLNAFGFGP
jgi:hypothetical protein